MTTVWRTQSGLPPPALDWIAPLQAVNRADELRGLREQVERARGLLAGTSETPDVEHADEALRLASHFLMTVLVDCGVETPLGWRLHQLRNRLDAHLLAASALREADAPGAEVSVLRRSVDVVALELEMLLAEAR